MRDGTGQNRVHWAPRRAAGGGGGGRRRLETIDSTEDQPFVDHKGRSKPMYKASRPRPDSWRPSRLVRLVLGAFPGARVMALSSVKSGALYALFGVGATVAAVMLSVTWSRTYDAFESLSIQRHWLLIHVAAWLGAILLFEILRLLSAIDHSIRGPIAPRILATFFIPSVAVIYATPKLVFFYPRLVEATFCAAVVLLAGALPAAIWSIGMALLRSPSAQRRLAFTCLGVALICAATVVAAVMLGGDAAADLETRGFQLLPVLLG